jgi:uncharacterized membrane protein YfcA
MTFTAPDYPVLFWITASIAVLLFGISKAGFAAGVGVLATPLVSLTVGVAEAAAILLPLLIVTDMLALFYYRRDFDKRSIKVLIPGGLAGILLGAFFFEFLKGRDDLLRLGIGTLALVFVAFQATRKIIFGTIQKHRPRLLEGLFMGTAGGFTSTIAHAGGPPVAIYLLPQQLPKHIYVGTTAVFFAITNAVKLIPYGVLGLLRPGNLLTVFMLAPLTYIGVRLGVYLNRRVNEVWFMRLVYILLFFSGIQLLWSGLMQK